MSNPRFILSKVIARGGMAEIYLGKQIGEDGFQRLCAIKRILPHYAQDKEFIEMFRDEAHICKRLQHANIVRVEGFEEVEKSFAIIMEFVDGSDLRSLLAASEKVEKRLSIAMACHLIAETARGLHYAHTKVDEITQQPIGIVHRDISPQNILVSYEGEVKVTDFGIADAENKLTETKAGTVKGKYSYMSPEQINGKKVDPRTDVFAMSVVLWEMLAMKRLFHGGSEVETIQLVRNCKLPFSLRSVNADVDEDLEKILTKGLSKDLKKRYAHAADFEKDLRRYLNHKFPDFTPQDLGDFLKTVLNDKRAESAADIKKVLTETNLRPGKSSKAKSKDVPKDLAFEADSNTNFSISKQITKTGPRKLSSSTASRSSASQFGTGRFTAKDMPGYPARKSKGSKNMLLGSAIAAAVSLILAVFLTTKNHDFRAQLLIRTTPATVKMSIDGAKFNGGKYLHTPIGLKIDKPGKHLVTIWRPGYHSMRFEFQGANGKTITKDKIVLKRKSRFAPTIIKGMSNKRVRINIDRGFVSAYLGGTKGGTVRIKDLIFGKTYTVRIASAKTKKDLFSCKFAPKAVSWRKPFQVLVNTKSKKCHIKAP